MTYLHLLDQGQQLASGFESGEKSLPIWARLKISFCWEVFFFLFFFIKIVHVF